MAGPRDVSYTRFRDQFYVDTIADLEHSSLSPLSGQLVTTLGYSSVADSGSLDLVYNSSGTGTIDGVSIFAGYGGTGRYLKITHRHQGTEILSSGEPSGVRFLGENGDGTSSWKLIEGTGIFSTGEVSGVKFLGENGDGTSSWKIVPSGGSGDMLKAENLSGLANYTTARSNLGLSTKTNFNTALTDGTFMFVGDAPTTHTHTESEITDLGNYGSGDMLKAENLSGLANYTTARSNLGLSTKTNFNTALTDGTFMFVGDAPTTHTHTESEITDLGNYGSGDMLKAENLAGLANYTTARSNLGLSTKTNFNTALTDGTFMFVGDAPTTHTHTESEITDLGTTVAMVADNLSVFAGTTMAQFDTLCNDGDFLYVGDGHTHLEADITDLGNYGSGDMLKAENLAGLANYTTARSNLGLSTKTNFNTALTDGTFMFVGDAPTTHTHTESEITDLGTTVAMVADNLSVFAGTTMAQFDTLCNDGDFLYVGDGHTHLEADITDLGNYGSGDMLKAENLAGLANYTTARSNLGLSTKTNFNTALTDGTFMFVGDAPTTHTHTESEITDLGTTVAMVADNLSVFAGTTMAQFDTLCNDGDFLYVGDGHTHLEADITDLGNYGSGDMLKAENLAGLANYTTARSNLGLSTKTNFNTALTDGTFMFVGDAPTTHTHTESEITDLGTTVAMVADNLSVFAGTTMAQFDTLCNDGDFLYVGDGHTHTESEITDLGTTVAMVADNLSVFAGTTMAQFDTLCNDGDFLYVGDGHTHTESEITDLGTTVAMVADNLSVFAGTTMAQFDTLCNDGDFLYVGDGHTHLEADITDLGNYGSGDMLKAENLAGLANYTTARSNLGLSTKTNFNTALTDGTFMFVGDAPTTHTHTESEITDLGTTVAMVADNLSVFAGTTMAQFDTLCNDGDFLYVGDGHTHLEADITDLGNYGSGDMLKAENLAGLANYTTARSNLGLSTKTNFNTALTDGTFMFVGDAPTTHTHTESEITDLGTTVAMVADNLSVFAGTTMAQFDTLCNDGDFLYVGDGHTHTESEITDLGTTVAMVADNLSVFAGTTMAQFDTLCNDGDFLYVGDGHTHLEADITDLGNYGSGDMLKAENLAGLANYTTARSNLGLSTKTNFNTALTDGTFMFVGDAPTTHTHTESEITDLGTTVAMVADNLSVFAGTTMAQFDTLCNDGDFLYVGDGHTHLEADITDLGNYGSGDMLKAENLAGLANYTTARSNLGLSTKTNFNTALTDGTFMFVGDAPTTHTHTESEITDLGTTVAMVADNLSVFAGTTMAQFDTLCNDGDFLYVGDGHTHLEADITDLGNYGSGDMLKAENLAGLANYTTARSNLGLSTKTNFNTALTNGTFMFVGDAPTTHTHTESEITDLGTTVAMVADNLSVFAGTTMAQFDTLCSDGDFLYVGDVGGGDMLKSENLSGLANYTTARSNLGLGSIATQPSHEITSTAGSGLTLTIDNGKLWIAGLPTSDPTSADQIWVNGGVLTISLGV